MDASVPKVVFGNFKDQNQQASSAHKKPLNGAPALAASPYPMGMYAPAYPPPSPHVNPQAPVNDRNKAPVRCIVYFSRLDSQHAVSCRNGSRMATVLH